MARSSTSRPRISDMDFEAVKAKLDAYHAHCARWNAAQRVAIDAQIAATGHFTDSRATSAAADAAVGVVENPFEWNSPILQDFYREQRRRGANASRTKNAEARAALAVPAGTYAVGEAVQVHSFGTWYRGVVTKLGSTGKVHVEYTTGTGVTRIKAVDSTKVRKAS